MTHLEDRRSPWQPIELLCKKHIPYKRGQQDIIEVQEDSKDRNVGVFNKMNERLEKELDPWNFTYSLFSCSKKTQNYLRCCAVYVMEQLNLNDSHLKCNLKIFASCMIIGRPFIYIFLLQQHRRQRTFETSSPTSIFRCSKHPEKRIYE